MSCFLLAYIGILISGVDLTAPSNVSRPRSIVTKLSMRIESRKLTKMNVFAIFFAVANTGRESSEATTGKDQVGIFSLHNSWSLRQVLS